MFDHYPWKCIKEIKKQNTKCFKRKMNSDSVINTRATLLMSLLTSVKLINSKYDSAVYAANTAE